MPPKQPHVALDRHRDGGHFRHRVVVSQSFGGLCEEVCEFVVIEAGSVRRPCGVFAQ
jgi:hypothetical protein